MLRHCGHSGSPAAPPWHFPGGRAVWFYCGNCGAVVAAFSAGSIGDASDSGHGRQRCSIRPTLVCKADTMPSRWQHCKWLRSWFKQLPRQTCLVPSWMLWAPVPCIRTLLFAFFWLCKGNPIPLLAIFLIITSEINLNASKYRLICVNPILSPGFWGCFILSWASYMFPKPQDPGPAQWGAQPDFLKQQNLIATSKKDTKVKSH